MQMLSSVSSLSDTYSPSERSYTSGSLALGSTPAVSRTRSSGLTLAPPVGGIWKLRCAKSSESRLVCDDDGGIRPDNFSKSNFDRLLQCSGVTIVIESSLSSWISVAAFGGGGSLKRLNFKKWYKINNFNIFYTACYLKYTQLLQPQQLCLLYPNLTS